MPGATLDVSTIRGKVAVRADDGRQIRIDGTVTVRAGVGGLTVPANALELAQRVADHPRIDVADNVVRLRPPLDADELRAVTVSYEVRVPRDTRLVIATDSGAITVDDVAAPVLVTTQSSAIDLERHQRRHRDQDRLGRRQRGPRGRAACASSPRAARSRCGG